MKAVMLLIGLLLSSSLSAADVPQVIDFTTKYGHLQFGSSDIGMPEITATTTIHNANLPERGSISIRYAVTDGMGTVIFDDVATINDGQTTVVVGNASIGKLRLTYDPAIDELIARYNLVLSDDFRLPYRVLVSQYPGPWYFVTEIEHGIVF